MDCSLTFPTETWSPCCMAAWLQHKSWKNSSSTPYGLKFMCSPCQKTVLSLSSCRLRREMKSCLPLHGWLSYLLGYSGKAKGCKASVLWSLKYSQGVSRNFYSMNLLVNMRHATRTLTSLLALSLVSWFGWFGFWLVWRVSKAASSSALTFRK